MIEVAGRSAACRPCRSAGHHERHELQNQQTGGSLHLDRAMSSSFRPDRRLVTIPCRYEPAATFLSMTHECRPSAYWAKAGTFARPCGRHLHLTIGLVDRRSSQRRVVFPPRSTMRVPPHGTVIARGAPRPIRSSCCPQLRAIDRALIGLPSMLHVARPAAAVIVPVPRGVDAIGGAFQGVESRGRGSAAAATMAGAATAPASPGRGSE